MDFKEVKHKQGLGIISRLFMPWCISSETWEDFLSSTVYLGPPYQSPTSFCLFDCHSTSRHIVVEVFVVPLVWAVTPVVGHHIYSDTSKHMGLWSIFSKHRMISIDLAAAKARN